MKSVTSRACLFVVLGIAGMPAVLAETDSQAPKSAMANHITLAQAEAVDDLQKYESRYHEQMMDQKTMQMLDVNADGVISREEFMHIHEAIFDMADKNKDGELKEDEMDEGSVPKMDMG